MLLFILFPKHYAHDKQGSGNHVGFFSFDFSALWVKTLLENKSNCQVFDLLP